MKSRREFIKTSGLAALSVPLMANTKIISHDFDTKPLNLGIIGCGDRGGGIAHMLKDHPNIKVVACCDILPYRLDAAAEPSGSKKHKDYRALLDNRNVEAVLIASPFGLHDEMAVDAIKAEKHIYCEKTMAKGVSEIQSVIDAQNGSKKIFQTGHQYSSSELYQKVIQMIASGYVGKITAFDCQWNRNGDWRREVPDAKWERIINWRMYKEHSGGLVAELCSHQIDFICRILGENPKKIVGFGGIDYWKDGRETFDNIHMLYEFPSGVNASFTCTTSNAFEDYKVRILGDKATIILDYTRAEIYVEKKALDKEVGIIDAVSGATKMAWDKGEGAPITAQRKDATKHALEQFYYSIRQDEPVISNMISGANTAKCVQISLDSMYQGKIAYWDDYPELKF